VQGARVSRPLLARVACQNAFVGLHVLTQRCALIALGRPNTQISGEAPTLVPAWSAPSGCPMAPGVPSAVNTLTPRYRVP
jgi:hypothetical protein